MKRPEAALQRAVVQYLHTQEAMGRLTFFAVPNGGKRGLIEAANFKREGARPGVPDLVILLPEDHTAMIELKAPKGRASKNQTEFMDRARQFTPNVFVVRDLESAKQTIDNLIRAFPKRVAA